MSKLKVILLENVKGQGKKGDIISVSEGYAKNFLFKNKKAVEATNHEIKKLESKKKRLEEKAIVEEEKAKSILEKIASKKIEIYVKSGENGKMFGSISSKEIAEKIKEVFNISIDKKKIESIHLKEVGEHSVNIKLHNNVQGKVIIALLPNMETM